MSDIHPSRAELQFLNLSFSRFFDLFDEVLSDEFWEKDDYYRFSKAINGFSIYSELLFYRPIQQVIERIKVSRPSGEAEIGSDLFKFIRNLTLHFPLFERWNDVWCSETLVTWERKGAIHAFLRKYSGKPEIKYRIMDTRKREETYLSVTFPEIYGGDHKIFLKDIICERDGVRFSYILMHQILRTQIE